MDRRGPASAPLGDGHTLSFAGRGPTGQFGHHQWTIAGLASDQIVNLMVTLHEAHHAALNSSTMWGALLQATAIAAELLPDQPQFGQTLTELVGRCRRTHEAYATHGSVVSILNADEDSTVTSLLSGFPVYHGYLADAFAVGPPGPLGLAWRQCAAESALVVCMQPAIAPLRVPLNRLRPAQFQEADSPDSRYATLCRLAPQLWAEVDELCAERMGRQWTYLKQVDLRRPETVWDIPDSLWLDLRRLGVQAATVALNVSGRPTLTVEQAQEETRGLITALSDALGGIPNPMIGDSDHRFGTAALYDLERIVLRPPLTARVEPAAKVPTPRLLSADGQRRHIYVVVRRAQTLRQHFRLESDPWTAEEIVCAVQVGGAGTDGQRRVDLYPIAGPEELARLAHLPTDDGVLASVSVSACRDAAWRARWLPELSRNTRMSMLLDLPLVLSIDALVEADRGFQYALARIPFSGEEQVVFGCAISDEPPVLRPCSLAAGQAFAEYASRRTNGATPTLDALGTSREHLRLVVAHLVLESSFM